MRQYVGARYVPKFMGAYDATQIYEALCVVDNGLGTSYISKVPTPAGTPLTDTDYWAIYGASSGAIISLQDQIDDMNDGTVPGSLQNQINEMQDGSVSGSLQDQINDLSSSVADAEKQIVILTDSYGMSGAPYADHSFLYYLEQRGILNYCSKWGYLFEGSIGFNPSNPSGTFQDLVQNNIATVDDDKVTDIYVVGGTNDAKNGDDITTLGPGFSTFITNALAKYPNVKTITMIYCPHMPLNQYSYPYPQVTYYAYLNGFMADSVDVQVVNAINAFNFNDLQSDFVHPSLSGQKKLARFILGLISGSKTLPSDYIYTAPAFGLSSAITGSATCTVELNDSTDTISISISITDFGTLASASTLTNLGNARITLGDDLYFWGELNGVAMVPCRISREGYFSILGRGGQTTNTTFLGKVRAPMANYLVCPQL